MLLKKISLALIFVLLAPHVTYTQPGPNGEKNEPDNTPLTIAEQAELRVLAAQLEQRKRETMQEIQAAQQELKAVREKEAHKTTAANNNTQPQSVPSPSATRSTCSCATLMNCFSRLFGLTNKTRTE